jgi:hypothetical protein
MLLPYSYKLTYLNFIGVYVSDGIKKLRYHIAGIPVCKDYFRNATGFTRQLFQKVEKFVLGELCISITPKKRK